jgi:squalene-hopene/tetraprenyl-beta-curcumene cyclase
MVYARILLAFALASTFPAQSLLQGQPDDRDSREVLQQTVAEGVAYLRTRGRARDGSYSSLSGPAVTALVTTALLRHGYPPGEAWIAESLSYVEEFAQPDGGIYQPGSLYRNYETSLAVLCFVEANRNGKYDQIIAAADRFLKGIQWDEGEGSTPSEMGYGGAGYGKHKRPDLSNTAFFVDALIASGNDPSSEALQRALAFISRSQNFESEHNTSPFSAKNPDGGFYYTPAAGGSSQAGATETGGLRSYGSMTYAGLKSMIYAGVDQDDPRVRAAFDWIGKHYRLDANPGMGSAGLYYYYHTFAKALAAMEVQEVTGGGGQKHNWRTDLIRELAGRQQKDGSWINENERWLEGDPNLVTGYALLALSYCVER